MKRNNEKTHEELEYERQKRLNEISKEDKKTIPIRNISDDDFKKMIDIDCMIRGGK